MCEKYVVEVSLIHGYDVEPRDKWFSYISRQCFGLFLKGRNVHEVMKLLKLSYLKEK
jgi:hypothetical protein